ncbi:MAG: hypothetical protein ACKVQW_14075 [Pyrinomonadaceae bacterium]
MRREDLKRLEKPYDRETRIEIDRRFHASIGADVPSANALAREIWRDLEPDVFGIGWWTLPDDERILIGDYLYQCTVGIATNLVEAKLHYLEWLDARDRANDRIADVVKFDAFGNSDLKMPPSRAPIDDLPNALESLHICGFFRAIGSSLDCLGAAIIGVLALKAGLRRSDIGVAEKALQVADAQIQKDFLDFYSDAKAVVGVNDWFEWTNAYRNMLIHRGRLIVQYQLVQRENPLLDARGKTIIRTKATKHLSKFPNKSDVEVWLQPPSRVLDEDAEVTLQGVFRSCRDLEETVCEQLVRIWKERRANPTLLEQPISQWKKPTRSTAFNGYSTPSKGVGGDMGMMNPVVGRRLRASAADDAHRHRWHGSKWAE